MIKIARILTVVAFTMLLTACADDAPIDAKKDDVPKAESAADKDAKKPEAAKPSAAERHCPQVAIIHDLAEVQDFGTEKPDAAEFVSMARMDSITGDCAYTDKGIDIDFTLNVISLRGPRLGGKYASYPYFVAIINPAGDIIRKERMTAEVEFSGTNKTATQGEKIHVLVPLTTAQQASGTHYRILMGFQLTEEQRKQGTTVAVH